MHTYGTMSLIYLKAHDNMINEMSFEESMQMFKDDYRTY